jgi:hypothetical protein
MGKSLSSDSARARSQKQQKEASRRAASDARERIPTGADGPEFNGRRGRADFQSAVSRKAMLTRMPIMSWPRRLPADR